MGRAAMLQKGRYYSGRIIYMMLVVMWSSGRPVLKREDAKDHLQYVYISCYQSPKLQEHVHVEANMYLTAAWIAPQLLSCVTYTV